MYAEIRATHKGSGKTFRVDREGFTLKVKLEPAEDLGGSPTRSLEMTARMSQGMGVRRGIEKMVTRELRVEFSEEDLAQIVQFALAHGLAGADFKKNIRLAHENLTNAASAFNVRLTRRSTKTRLKRRVG